MRQVAAGLLGLGLGLMALAWLCTLHISRHASLHNVWPIHSKLFMPEFLALLAWCCLGGFVYMVLRWLIMGDRAS